MRLRLMRAFTIVNRSTDSFFIGHLLNPSNQTVSQREDRGLKPAPDPKLGEDIVHVVSHRGGTDEELRGDDLGRVP